MQRPSSAQPERRPTFYDLTQHADAGPLTRAVTRYLVPRNPESSVRRHQRLGSPIVRKVVMGTIGRLISKPFESSNYRMSIRRGRMEGAMHFALKESAFNEAVHLIAGLGGLSALGNEMAEGRGIDFVGIGSFTANALLVALQRYNRARMVRFVDRQLQRGEEFRPGYRNWLHVDASAYENFVMIRDEASDQADWSDSEPGEMLQAVDAKNGSELSRPDSYPEF